MLGISLAEEALARRSGETMDHRDSGRLLVISAKVCCVYVLAITNWTWVSDRDASGTFAVVFLWVYSQSMAFRAAVKGQRALITVSANLGLLQY